MKSLIATALAVFLAAAAPAWAGGASVGQRFEISPTGLSAPYAFMNASNPPKIVPRPDRATLSLPPGFSASLFAEGLTKPRGIVVADNGDVLVSEPSVGRITVLRDEDGDGQADLSEVFATRLNRPHGLAIQGGFLYVAAVDRLWRFHYSPGQTEASGKPLPVTPRGSLGSAIGHWTRDLAFSPKGDRIFVTIGSRANIGEEASPRATVQVFNADGSGQRTLASGLRNPVGIAIHPETGDPFVVVNERDGLGDELVPDYLTRVQKGDFFGWPYAYTGTNPQPRFAEKNPKMAALSKLPDLLFRAHSAPLGLVFYTGSQFPAEYRGDAFVALHGSWNALVPRGYMVVRVPFEGGKPAGHYEAFATGFWASGEARAEVWGRPAGLAVAPDGSLFITDDAGGAVWRVSYRAP